MLNVLDGYRKERKGWEFYPQTVCGRNGKVWTSQSKFVKITNYKCGLGRSFTWLLRKQMQALCPLLRGNFIVRGFAKNSCSPHRKRKQTCWLKARWPGFKSTLEITSYMILDRAWDFTVLLSPHLWNENNACTSLERYLQRLGILIMHKPAWQVSRMSAAPWTDLGSLKYMLMLGSHLQRFYFNWSKVWPGHRAF